MTDHLRRRAVPLALATASLTVAAVAVVVAPTVPTITRRLKLAAHVLAGRPLVYRAVIAGGIDLAQQDHGRLWVVENMFLPCQAQDVSVPGGSLGKFLDDPRSHAEGVVGDDDAVEPL